MIIRFPIDQPLRRRARRIVVQHGEDESAVLSSSSGPIRNAYCICCDLCDQIQATSIEEIDISAVTYRSSQSQRKHSRAVLTELTI